jgi:riboflavin kinase/FMN adenylyltransferase
MELFFNLDQLPAHSRPTIVSIGNFDGVHLAHARVLKEIARRGVEQKKQSLAVTFEPHPMRVLRPDVPLSLITPTPEKLRLLERAGIDAAVVLPFTAELSEMPPETFVREILWDRLRACEVHEGFNFRFGHKASGDVALLKDFGRKLGFEVILYPEMRIRNEPVSSSHIRSLLADGEVGRARHLLGRPFSVEATMAHGRGYGSRFTVPTINLGEYGELIPKNGVYVTRTRVGVECFDSVTNVGNRPTFGRDSFAVESHLMNFRPFEVADETRVKVHFLKRLRDEIKFPSVEALREQISRDVKRAQRYFSLLED